MRIILHAVHTPGLLAGYLVVRRTTISAVAFLLLISPQGVAASKDQNEIIAPSGAPAAIWREIKLGTFQSVIQLREALESRGCGSSVLPAARRSTPVVCHLGDDANEALGRPPFSLLPHVKVMALTRITVAHLGFTDAATPTITELYQSAESAGLSVCPAEVGPQLRLQYLDQPLGEFLAIATQPMSNYAGDRILFLVGNGGAGLLLASRTGQPQTKVPSFLEFVFCLSQKSELPEPSLLIWLRKQA